MRIGPNGWPPASTGVAQKPQAGFGLRPRAAVAAAGGVAVAGGMMGLGGIMPSPRDVLARRRGRALLGGLGALQRAMLAGRTDDEALRGLAGLVEGEDGEDPEMAEAMRALALRARIELARTEAVTTSR